MSVHIVALPGVPASGTPEAQVFWTSFWPALYSGMISGILTGVFVGLVVWALQKQAERRIELRQINSELAIVRERLYRIAQKRDVVLMDVASKAIPSRIYETLDILNSSPLRKWRQEIGRNFQRPLIEKLILLENSYVDFLASSDDFSILLRQVVRHHNHERDIDIAYDSLFHTYGIGRIGIVN
ncbi:hypothetical protein [Leptolyngbya sp. FACHB-541]|uniref:hypothetical protein n=1 Tax=Leptolyngbya sp. FACHB-541 TaxID=2692810 RepID=UPI001684F8CC|nr:hypothetical protein [Leptolyngbya sp. FACHB-541]